MERMQEATGSSQKFLILKDLGSGTDYEVSSWAGGWIRIYDLKIFPISLVFFRFGLYGLWIKETKSVLIDMTFNRTVVVWACLGRRCGISSRKVPNVELVKVFGVWSPCHEKMMSEEAQLDAGFAFNLLQVTKSSVA